MLVHASPGLHQMLDDGLHPVPDWIQPRNRANFEALYYIVASKEAQLNQCWYVSRGSQSTNGEGTQ